MNKIIAVAVLLVLPLAAQAAHPHGDCVYNPSLDAYDANCHVSTQRQVTAPPIQLAPPQPPEPATQAPYRTPALTPQQAQTVEIWQRAVDAFKAERERKRALGQVVLNNLDKPESWLVIATPGESIEIDANSIFDAHKVEMGMFKDGLLPQPPAFPVMRHVTARKGPGRDGFSMTFNCRGLVKFGNEEWINLQADPGAALGRVLEQKVCSMPVAG